MFMHKSKKGFTIVELVIVIAVIAILAAVLIPTFSNLVKKANIAADTQLAKNLNTAMTMAEAEGKKLENFNDVLAALREGGYIVSNLNPTAEGHYFVWEKASNQILLVNGEKSFEVTYKSKELANTTPSATWFFAVSNPAVLAELKETLTASGLNNDNYVYTPKTAEDMDKVVQEIFANSSTAAVETIVVSESIKLGSLGLEVGHKDSVITVDLAGNSLTTTKKATNMTGQTNITTGTLNVSNGTLNSAEGSGCAVYVGNGVNNVDPGEGEYAVINVSGMNIQSTDISTNNSAISALVASGRNAAANISNTTINASAGRGVYARGGSVVISNTTITTKKAGSYGDCVSAAFGAGNVTATGCNMTATGDYVAHVYSSGGTIEIRNSTLVRTDSDKIIGMAGGTCRVTLGADVTLNGKSVSKINWDTEMNTYVYGAGTISYTKNADGSVTFAIN